MAGVLHPPLRAVVSLLRRRRWLIKNYPWLLNEPVQPSQEVFQPRIARLYCMQLLCRGQRRRTPAGATSASRPSSFLSLPSVFPSASVLGGRGGGKVAAWAVGVGLVVHILYSGCCRGVYCIIHKLQYIRALRMATNLKCSLKKLCDTRTLFIKLSGVDPPWCCMRSVMCRDGVSPHAGPWASGALLPHARAGDLQTEVSEMGWEEPLLSCSKICWLSVIAQYFFLLLDPVRSNFQDNYWSFVAGFFFLFRGKREFLSFILPKLNFLWKIPVTGESGFGSRKGFSLEIRDLPDRWVVRGLFWAGR